MFFLPQPGQAYSWHLANKHNVAFNGRLHYKIVTSMASLTRYVNTYYGDLRNKQVLKPNTCSNFEYVPSSHFVFFISQPIANRKILLHFVTAFSFRRLSKTVYQSQMQNKKIAASLAPNFIVLFGTRVWERLVEDAIANPSPFG